MDFIQTGFDELTVIKNTFMRDSRGAFVKRFNDDDFIQNGIAFSMKEQYYSVSQKNVVRGMHFQRPPFEHSKLVYVINGSILDVVLDIRKGSKTYGKFFSIELNENENTSLYIPVGFAHGFKALEDNTLMLYNVSGVYNRECDQGIKWDSIGFNWNISNPVLSDRDRTFIPLSDFETPFHI
ncbi:MAG: dTDP-4-dehydrorhamnose 3,5-epimerase [Ruminococcaceae bacterium]|nr:dTDP-4-dehydrorhamnose 3,5-epimerase [Oscillospiraceae bacterium]